ncbi:hypothetical protein CYMTET_5877 [Cymbomonas tetramitiformis]|uniref:DUF2326 domain-containing protein n=1 Tax=Cymbomonas tetramitiformis TaxID=36881 RepID=A0AAE0GYK8_9CHLO|nr:hypothetical protein CYMTET_5814 [Cymbomonas tetramitiformis]KAK3286651.1 hypothetical protein CYMTET_5877 [Cymbomonas tetramitiformis]
MIVELSSDLETFKTLRFSSGLNILLADRHEASTARDTRNGTGKTSFIELLHYLLSEKRNSKDDFHKAELIGAEYSMQFAEDGKKFTISRKSGPTDEAKKDGQIVVPIDLRAELMQKWFGLTSEETNEEFSPKFSALLSYFARKARNGGFENPTLNASKQSGWDSQVCVSYLLGFDWRLPQQLQIKKEQKKSADTLYTMIKGGYFTDGELDLNKMQARLDFLDLEVEQKRSEVTSSRVVDGYRQHEVTANDFAARIRDLNEANLEDLDLVESIEQALSEVEDAQVADVESLYKQVGVFFSEQVKHRFEQVFAFHEQVARNRDTHLRREMRKARERLATRRAEIQDLQNGLSEKLDLLRSGMAIERLVFLQSDLNLLEAEQGDLMQQIPRFRNVTEDRRRLKREIDDLVDAIGQDVFERSAPRKAAVDVFAATSKFLYDEPGSLVIGRSSGVGGLSIETDIVGKKSGGKNHMQVFCFDWLLAEASLKQDKFPGFLIHDSHIFDGVDGRQIGLALEFAQKKCEELSIQYIVAMNSDDLQKIEWEEDGFNANDYVIDTILTDEPGGGLFGTRF